MENIKTRSEILLSLQQSNASTPTKLMHGNQNSYFKNRERESIQNHSSLKGYNFNSSVTIPTKLKNVKQIILIQTLNIIAQMMTKKPHPDTEDHHINGEK